MSQSTEKALLVGTVTDATGAVIHGAAVRLAVAGEAPEAPPQERDTDRAGAFSFGAHAGWYVLMVDAPGFAAYRSKPLDLKPLSRMQLPVRLAVASLQQEIDVLDESGLTPGGAAGELVFEGDTLNLLSNDPLTLGQQLNALAGGGGTAGFQVDGFSGGKLPPKSAIRSIRINRNLFSAYYADYGAGHVDITTASGADKLHGSFDLSGGDGGLDARNPYTAVKPPFYDFQQDGNLNGPIDKKTSFFVSESVEQLANSAVVNAADPLAPATPISTAVPAPQRTRTYCLRLDRQFSPKNFGYAREEWSRTHIADSGIVPLVLPEAAYTSDTLTNTVQLSDTQVLGVRAINEVRFQYLRTRDRQDPNSTLPSVVVESAFQSGGSPAQRLRDNQDAVEAQDLFELERGHHAMRAGFRFRALREANQSAAGFNGQYIFPDVASYQAGQASQFSISTGQQNALLRNDDVGIYAEDDWKLTPNLTFSYGLRFESESAIPDGSDPAPRLGVAWAVRPGRHKTPVVTLRGGYGIFYDRFPATQLLQATRQNGSREVAYFALNTGFDPNGPPPGVVLGNAQPTIYQVDPRLRSTYEQVSAFTVTRSLGRYGSVSGNLVYAHTAHGFLTRNANAPLPGTFDPRNPASGVRPLGTQANVYQFASAGNGNLERFFLNYQLRFGKRLWAFGVFDADKNNSDSDGVAHFVSNPYDVRADYGRASSDRARMFTGGFRWTLPYGVQATPFLTMHSGNPFDITTGTDLNGDTVYNDRPALAADLTRGSVVHTGFGNFDVAPGPGETVLPRNYGTAPAYVWLQLTVNKDFHVGPRSKLSPPVQKAASAGAPDRPWDLNFAVEIHNLTNHNNPGLPVGALSAQPCGATQTAACGDTGNRLSLAPSGYFGHSLSLAGDFSPVTASNRTILLQTSLTF